MIEKGRHLKPKLERDNRKCPYCVECVEDECHFIIQCPLYNNNRNELLTEVMNDCINFNIMTNKQKFIFIMTNEKSNIMQKLAKFVYTSFKIRNEFLRLR